MEDIIDNIEKASGYNWRDILDIRRESMMAWKCIFVEEALDLLKSMDGATFLKSRVGGCSPKTPVGSDSPKIAEGGHSVKSLVGYKGRISECYGEIASMMGGVRSAVYYYRDYKKGSKYAENRAKYDLVKAQNN